MSYYENAMALREAMDIAGAALNEEQAISCARLYRGWEVGKAYQIGDFLTYGVNAVGDPQLYKVVQAHTSQEDWKPRETASLYSPLGLDEKGYPTWQKPTGAHDAYNKGDIVNYNGSYYQSLIDGNIWSPEEYSQGWERTEV